MSRRFSLPMTTEPPHQLFSQATVEYVGFDKQKANEIWTGWINWPPGPGRYEIDPDDGDLQVTFLDWIKGHASYSNDIWLDDDAGWIDCMRQKGIATELQQAIMDPKFKYMRMTGTCITWVRDTIKMRYAGLEDMARTESRYPGSPAGPSHLLSISGIATDSCNSTRALAATNESGMTVLFKAIDCARATGLLDAQGQLSRIGVLESTPPSDFSKNKSMFYFTTSFGMAKRYAAWAKRRTKCESIVIIRIAIENSVIESIPEGKIQRLHWPSPDWKEVIWRCRTKNQPSRALRKYADATLVIGTVANKPNEYYYDFQSGSELTETSVLKVDGPGGQQPAIQFAFSSEEEGEDLLLEAASETFQMFSFISADMEIWMSETNIG
ncbi:hypothetical protein FPOAC2_09942 [Fusarium poae]|uniref:Uncharacterized protein n=1 Tax=Fusarium poae TaxID=36050 RepID=A0A1B8AR00_FUSPO|nr:hypothetical protein FPOAC1_010002 [Fusarium poae]KAG8670577.1 hypothetical protein FPOAC1_010002 [Fusarium poae]OBS22774.1 hypothetical protein FPOA_09102 [Fusarium poae]